MSKKTFSVDQFRKEINDALKITSDRYCPSAGRQGLMYALESVLHQTGNYKGFRYLLQDEVPVGSLPGIIVNGTVEDTPHEDRFPEGKVDSTRVEYF